MLDQRRGMVEIFELFECVATLPYLLYLLYRTLGDWNQHTLSSNIHLGALLAERGELAQVESTRPDQTRPDKTRPDKTRQDKTRPDKTRQDQNGPDGVGQVEVDKTRCQVEICIQIWTDLARAEIVSVLPGPWSECCAPCA